MGLFGGGDSTIETETDLPDWLKPYWKRNLERQDESQDFAGDIREGMLDWRPAGWSREEEAALGLASELPSELSGYEGASTGFLEAGTGVLDDLTEGSQGITEEELAGFMNPYTESVVDASIRDMEDQAIRAQMRDEARASGVGGATGSRMAVADILREKQLGRETADVGNRLRSDAFRFAVDTSTGRKKDAASGLGQYSQLADQLATSKTDRDLSIADKVAQAGLTKRTGMNAQDMWDMQLQDWYQGQVGQGIASPGGVTSGSQTNPSPSGFSQLLGAGTTLGAAALMNPGMFAGSDEAIKVDFDEAPGLEDIKKIDPASYRYIGDDHRTAGVIAQNVEDILPDAVTLDPVTGFRAVDYAPIISGLINSVKTLDERMAA